MDLSIVKFIYVNHRGERGLHTVRPIRVYFGSTAYHPEAQWLLEAFDLDRRETRDFALSNIGGWNRATHPSTDSTPREE